MKITGFTIIRNAVLNDYPIVEAITSILPVVDDMIVLVGKSEDSTEALIRSIPSDKIRIHHSVWDPSVIKGGEILAIETNKAFDLVPADSDWAFYIQGDEVVHEQYHASIRATAEKYLTDQRVEGLLFNYTHFYGTYDYVGDSRRWYHKEIRLVRNDKTIRSYLDAQGFRKAGEKLRVKPVDAHIYHYGWVKSPAQMLQKQKNVVPLWSDTEQLKALHAMEVFDYSDFDSLEKFKGTHPNVMQSRVAGSQWKLDFDLSRKQFNLKERLLYWFEKKTGIRLFAYKNYKLI
ncbi:MAG: glycosyltransferase family 2 protein [Candidatus Pseudobacter hemicellulosilyticus]|uniref:Glycosyltransferase family 2 protein n=1 Tax=Candidatus Pseudobacter hemicellulosilyticus TaxID=3121375 RepID=A0AAJ5WUD3_9BACT|nr:MAG: glycosyltransferase family 2 protein [Pseudobacter sp.]